MPMPKCTLCDHTSDPRTGLLTTAGVYYPLCDGCSPINEPQDIAATVEKCRAAEAKQLVQRVVLTRPRFGVNESDATRRPHERTENR